MGWLVANFVVEKLPRVLTNKSKSLISRVAARLAFDVCSTFVRIRPIRPRAARRRPARPALAASTLSRGGGPLCRAADGPRTAGRDLDHREAS